MHRLNNNQNIKGYQSPVNLTFNEVEEFDFDENEIYGCVLENKVLTFKVWSPTADKISLIFFDENQNRIFEDKNFELLKNGQNVWQKSLNFDSKMTFYQYEVEVRGKKFLALDPYAKSMASFSQNSNDIIGKSAIIDFSKFKKSKQNFLNSRILQNKLDIIAYEINVRDFTIQPNIFDEKIAGTFSAFKQKIPYLKELGITHVQLMPINKCYTIDETNKKFTSKTSKQSNYNWGYDVMNYFTIEGKYSTNPHEPYTRIQEFKELVNELHNNGIGVILDVVFNHTFAIETFENIAPACWYRKLKNGQISETTGAGASLETRHKHVRKFIIDVLKYFISEFHVDGFRFDLMEFIDIKTIKEIRKEVGKLYNPEDINDLILQGEAWEFSDIENGYSKINSQNIDNKLNIGLFNDIFRDAVLGNNHSHGFIFGNTELTENVATGIVAGLSSFDNESFPFRKNIFYDAYKLFANSPADCLNYISIHDGLTLWDKINLKFGDASKKKRLQFAKFASAILLTSQGKIILHGGDEILRTKPLSDFDKSKHRAMSSHDADIEENTVFFHENTYASNDYTNMFRWDRLKNEYKHFANELVSYYKGLIKLRRSVSAFRLTTSELLNSNFKFITNFDENLNLENKSAINTFKNNNLKHFTIKFINGQASEKYYLTGEIHKEKPNPEDNKYFVIFDENGNAKISFSEKEIANFNLQMWDLSRNLNIKLVKTAGKWDYLPYSYSPNGNNKINPSSLNDNYEIIVDLSVKDYATPFYESNKRYNYIAFLLKNPISSERYKKLIVVHNANENFMVLNTKLLKDAQNWCVLVDKNKAGMEAINSNETEVVISENKLEIPARCTTVIAYKY